MHSKLREPIKVNTQIEKDEHEEIMKLVRDGNYTKASVLRMLIYKGLKK